MSASQAKFSATAVPPEVILDRYVRDELARIKGCEGYVGKQNLELLEPDLRSLLVNIQQAFNEGLQRENTKVSGGVDHLPFHVDYVAADTPNALAFQYEGYAFVVMTTPLVEMLLKICDVNDRAMRRSTKAMLLVLVQAPEDGWYTSALENA